MFNQYWSCIWFFSIYLKTILATSLKTERTNFQFRSLLLLIANITLVFLWQNDRFINFLRVHRIFNLKLEGKAPTKSSRWGFDHLKSWCFEIVLEHSYLNIVVVFFFDWFFIIGRRLILLVKKCVILFFYLPLWFARLRYFR